MISSGLSSVSSQNVSFNIHGSIIQKNFDNSQKILGNFNIIPFEELNHDKVRRNKLAYQSWKYHKKGLIDDLLQKHKLELTNDILVNPNVPTWSDSGIKEYLDIFKVEEWNVRREKYIKDIEDLEDRDFNLKHFVQEKFGFYLDDIKGCRAYVLGVDYEKRYHGFEVFNRYGKEYAKNVKNHFDQLKDAGIISIDYTKSKKHIRVRINTDKSVFLTLTFDNMKVKNKQYAWEILTEEWNRFKTALFYYTGHLEYIMTVEAQKRGMPHIHVLFFGTSYLLPNGTSEEYKNLNKNGVIEDKKGNRITIESLWKNGYTFVNKTKSGKSIKRPLNYMFKITDGSVCKKGSITQAFLWFFNRRAFNVSRGLGNWLNQYAGGEVKDIEGNYVKADEITWVGLMSVYGDNIVKSNEDLTVLYRNYQERFKGYG